MVGDKVIGAVQSIEVKETKTEREGQDGYTINITITANRIRFDKERIKEVFDKSFNVANQVYSFDIVVIEDYIELARIKRVWLTSIDYAYDATEWIIVNQAMMQAEKIEGTI